MRRGGACKVCGMCCGRPTAAQHPQRHHTMTSKARTPSSPPLGNPTAFPSPRTWSSSDTDILPALLLLLLLQPCSSSRLQRGQPHEKA